MAASDPGGRLGTMAVFFLVALVIVSPFAWVRIRRVLRDHDVPLPGRPRRAGDDARAAGGSAAGVVADDAAVGAPEVADVVAAIDAGVARGGEFDVVVPAGLHLGGRPVARATVDALVADALRRARVEVVTTREGPDGRHLRCRPHPREPTPGHPPG